MGDEDSDLHECPACTSTYCSQQEMLSHFTSDHDSEEQRSGVKNKESERYTLTPPVDNIPCRVCTKEFESMLVMMNHMTHKHSEERLRSALCDEIDRLYEHFGRVPTSKDTRDLKTPNHKIYKRLFGSWAKALEEAGYEPIRRRIDPNKEQLLAEIHRVANLVDGTPKQHHMQNEGIYAQGAYYSKFQSWNKALKEAGYETYSQRNRTAGEIKYGLSWGSKRKQTTERDNNKCRVCNKHSSEIEHTSVNVHHIKPAREFGAHDPDVDTDYEEMNDLSNLICLCPACHGQLEGKFQDADPDEFAELGRERLGIDVEAEIDTTQDTTSDSVQTELPTASD